MTLKPGDRVWAACDVCGLMPRGQTVIVGDLRDKDAGRFYQGIDHIIPDVPNLAHIARFLAEHPETVDALDLVVQAANAMEEFIPASLPDRRDAPGIVSGLLKAMRGEGEHDAG